MENIEDKFVAGEWIPPFIEPSPAPKKRKVRKKNPTQPSPVTPKQTRKPIKKAKKVRTLLLTYPVSNFDL